MGKWVGSCWNIWFGHILHSGHIHHVKHLDVDDSIEPYALKETVKRHDIALAYVNLICIIVDTSMGLASDFFLAFSCTKLRHFLLTFFVDLLGFFNNVWDRQHDVWSFRIFQFFDHEWYVIAGWFLTLNTRDLAISMMPVITESLWFPFCVRFKAVMLMLSIRLQEE